MHEQAGHDPTAFVDRGIEADAGGSPLVVDAQIVQLGDREQRVKQIIHTDAGDGTGLHDLRLPAPLGRQQLVRRQLLVDSIHVGAGKIDLIDAHDDRHIGGPRVADRLLRLRHHAVVGSHHDDGTVGHIGTACPHLRERLVARRVDERDWPPVPLYGVGPHVLRDATTLAGSDIHAENAIEQRRLAMINVAEKRHHRGTRRPQGGILVSRVESGQKFLLEILGGLDVELHAEFSGQQLHRVAVEHRRHARHGRHAKRQQFLQDFAGRQADRLREGADVAGDLNGGIRLPRRGGRHR